MTGNDRVRQRTVITVGNHRVRHKTVTTAAMLQMIGLLLKGVRTFFHHAAFAIYRLPTKVDHTGLGTNRQHRNQCHNPLLSGLATS